MSFVKMQRKDEQRCIKYLKLEIETPALVGNHRSCLPSYKTPVWVV